MELRPRFVVYSLGMGKPGELCVEVYLGTAAPCFRGAHGYTPVDGPVDVSVEL